MKRRYNGAGHVHGLGNSPHNPPEIPKPDGVDELLLIAKVQATWLPTGEWWVLSQDKTIMDTVAATATFEHWQNVLGAIATDGPAVVMIHDVFRRGRELSGKSDKP